MKDISSQFFIPRDKSEFSAKYKRVRIMPLYSFPHINDFKPNEFKKPRFFLHLDFDAFYAQVEQRDNVHLRGKPVSVGGIENGKGIVMTASYEARKMGVKVGMSVMEAKKICPQLVSLPCDGVKYETIMHSLLEIIGNFTPPEFIEQYSVDECFVDLTPVARTFEKAKEIALAIKRTLREKEELTVSMGLSFNKSYAKLSTNFSKPDGFSFVEPETREKIYEMTADKLWGIGRRIYRRMLAMGIVTIGDLAASHKSWIKKEFGVNGTVFRMLARGEDYSGIINKERPERSFNHNHTLFENIYKPEDVNTEIRRMVEYIGRKLRSKELTAGHLALSIRFEDLKYTGGDYKLAQYTNDDRILFSNALKIYETLPKPTEKLQARMFGISVFNLEHDTKAKNLDLFDPTPYLPYYALDKIKSKYGERIIRVGIGA